MLTREEIAAETANSLSPTEQAMWLALFRSYPGYSLSQYPDAAAKLAAATGVTAKQLLAALRKIEEVGSDTTRLEGKIDFDPSRDRGALIAYGLSVLYEGVTSLMPTLFALARGGRGR